MKVATRKFLDFIQQPAFPCTGAKVVSSKKLLQVIQCKNMRSSDEDEYLLFSIYNFIAQLSLMPNSLHSFAVIFNAPLLLTEEEFENLLWTRLQQLHILDHEFYPWCPDVSFNVLDSNFSFSLGSKAFFIIGLHANSSRKARQFSYPTLVFNPHDQFEALRQKGVFEKMKQKIRQRDMLYSGSINPMLNDFGKESEALQYSGRLTNKICMQAFDYKGR